ncbi:MAG: hypothetical protein JXA25_16170 [Anaerolineales bacterium]|nr:hypothetical protein [Anaerolineales bacterium]
MRRASSVAFLLAFVLVGCSLFGGGEADPEVVNELPTPEILTISAPNPEAAVKQFLSFWNDQNYEAMYLMLSPLTTDLIGEEEFTSRYESIWKAANLAEVHFEILSSLVNPEAAHVRARVGLVSAVVGEISRDIEMNLVRVEDDWKISWDDSVILPELTPEVNLWMDMVLPTRANIYDRNGSALAVQTDIVALWLTPNQVDAEDGNEERMLSGLSRLFGTRYSEIQAIYDDIRQYDWYVHIGEVSLAEFQEVEGTLSAVNGLYWKIYSGRYYWNEGIASHAVGYVNWIPEAQLGEYISSGYKQDEYVGQLGLEAVYEETLRGSPGGSLYLVDTNGRVLQGSEALAYSESTPPQAVYSSLDRDLQAAVEAAIAGFEGAVVVLERDTGAVLALASAPGFDSNLFNTNHPYSYEGLQEIFSDTDLPLINRATGGEYPPGSVFKVVTEAAALESGYFEADDIYDCGNTFTEIPGLVLYDWTYEKEKPAQGEITLQEALVRSCNPYFYHIGLELFNQGQPAAISDMAKAFGLGVSTGIEIGDQTGIVPDPDLKLAMQGVEWLDRDPVNLAIGQSFLTVTPLQVVRYMAAIGNGGTLYRPQLVNRIESVEGEIIDAFSPEAQGTLPVSDEHLAVIQEAMVDVIRGAHGTARNRFLGLNLNIAGKTGTATSGETTESHAWFSGYTFEENENYPDIAIVVMLEYQGEGSDWAAPIFRRVVESYFFGRPYAVYPWESQIGVLKTATPTPEPGAEEATPEP